MPCLGDGGGGDYHKNSYSSIWAYGHSLTYFYSPATDSAERVYGVRMTCTEPGNGCKQGNFLS